MVKFLRQPIQNQYDDATSGLFVFGFCSLMLLFKEKENNKLDNLVYIA